MPRVLAALLSIAFLPGAAWAGQDPLTPDQHLDQVRQMLAALPTGQSPAEQTIATLQRDFADFASAYLATRTGGTTVPAAPTPAPTAGAASSAAPALPPADWRSKYLVVESDLTALISPRDAPPQTVSLDAAIVARLQQIRQHLGAFYAATIDARDGNPVAHTGPDRSGAPVPPTGAAPQSPPRTETGGAAQPPDASGRGQGAPARDVDHSAAIALLDRMQALVDGALNGTPVSGSSAPVGTSGSNSKAGKVTIDRAALDEIRAEIAQIRLMLGR